MLEEKDPLAVALFQQYKQVQMPNLRLGGEDVDSILKFLETQNIRADDTNPAAGKSPPSSNKETSPQ